MKKKIKILTLLFTIIFIYSCGTAQDALVGKKRSEQGDEFLIDKKNPLSTPPDFDKLPEPGESRSALSNENQTNDSEIKNLLTENVENTNAESISNNSTSLENLIIEKIK